MIVRVVCPRQKGGDWFDVCQLDSLYLVPRVGELFEPFDGWAAFPVELVIHRPDSEEVVVVLRQDTTGELELYLQKRGKLES